MTMPTTRRIRKMFLGLGILLLALIVLVAAMPLWLPWILRPVARPYGVHYSNYQRAGYSRFVLTDLRLTNETIRFQARQAEAFVPTVWLWLHSFGSRDGQKTFWRVADWQLEILDATKKPQPSPRLSAYRTLQKT